MKLNLTNRSTTGNIWIIRNCMGIWDFFNGFMNKSSEKHPQLKPCFIDDSIWSIAFICGRGNWMKMMNWWRQNPTLRSVEEKWIKMAQKAETYWSERYRVFFSITVECKLWWIHWFYLIWADGQWMCTIVHCLHCWQQKNKQTLTDGVEFLIVQILQTSILSLLPDYINIFLKNQ